MRFNFNSFVMFFLALMTLVTGTYPLVPGASYILGDVKYLISILFVLLGIALMAVKKDVE